jgi:hypothetical protein
VSDEDSKQDTKVASSIPWHRGYLEPRIWTITVVGGLIVILLYNFLTGVSSYILRATIVTLGYFSQTIVDTAYGMAVVDPTLSFFAAIFGSGIMITTIFTITRALGTIISGRYSPRKESEHNIETTSINSRIVGSVLCLVLLCVALTAISIPMLAARAKDVTERRIMILTPYISDHDRQTLVGEWGAVRNEHDFKQLMLVMDATAKSHHISLPPSNLP